MHYNRSETYLIKHSIKGFDWSKSFSGKNVHEVELFNKTLLNIFHNFIPSKFVACDDRDPPWMNDEIKKLIMRRNSLFQSQRKSRNLDFNFKFAISNSPTQDVSDAIIFSKLKYYVRLANKLNYPKAAPNTN